VRFRAFAMRLWRTTKPLFPIVGFKWLLVPSYLSTKLFTLSTVSYNVYLYIRTLIWFGQMDSCMQYHMYKKSVSCKHFHIKLPGQM
jgi:hypothetical protein